MKKTVILSTNNNPDYLKYIPYVQQAWNKLGWNTLTFYRGKGVMDSNEQNQVLNVPDYSNTVYKEATIVQVIRLFAHQYVDGMIMTGDADMIPMCNYWRPIRDKITVYGIDLTGDEQIPMCYVAMDAKRWAEIIPEYSLLDLLEKYPQAKSDDFQKYWFTDQDILTDRIMPLDFVRVDRGIRGNLATGRIDRANWEATLNAPGIKIDAHMPRPFDEVIADGILFLVEA